MCSTVRSGRLLVRWRFRGIAGTQQTFAHTYAFSVPADACMAGIVHVCYGKGIQLAAEKTKIALSVRLLDGITSNNH
jgi:hypothetical protein